MTAEWNMLRSFVTEAFGDANLEIIHLVTGDPNFQDIEVATAASKAAAFKKVLGYMDTLEKSND